MLQILKDPEPRNKNTSEPVVIDLTSIDSDSDSSSTDSMTLKEVSPRPRTENDFEQFSQDWYDDEVGDGTRRDIKISVLWQGIGVDKDIKIKGNIWARAETTITPDIAKLSFSTDQRQHHEVKTAMKAMEKDFVHEITRRRPYCTKEFRDILWYKLIKNARLCKLRSNKESSDDTCINVQSPLEARKGSRPQSVSSLFRQRDQCRIDSGIKETSMFLKALELRAVLKVALLVARP